MAKLTEKEYASNKGMICPNCGSKAVNTSEAAEVYDGGGTQNCSCGTCHAEWTDIYILEGYSNLVTLVED